MKTFREIADEVMRRPGNSYKMQFEVMAECMQALADEMDRRYPPKPREGESSIDVPLRAMVPPAWET